MNFCLMKHGRNFYWMKFGMTNFGFLDERKLQFRTNRVRMDEIYIDKFWLFG
jgi:hypothetical protein